MLHDGEWYACQEHPRGDVLLGGDRYKKIVDVKEFDGHEGQVVLGYIKVFNVCHEAMYKYRFIPVKQPLVVSDIKRRHWYEPKPKAKTKKVKVG